MQRADIALQCKFPDADKQSNPWPPVPHPEYICKANDNETSDLTDVLEFTQNSPANNLVPNSEKSSEKEDINWTNNPPKLETKLKEGGYSHEFTSETSVTEYRESGYTRRKPWETEHKVDNDFAGKWERDFTLLSGKAEFFEEEISAANGSFDLGGASQLKGNGSALSAGAKSSAEYSLGSKGLEASASAKAEASALKGEIGLGNEEGVANAGASGAALSGEAEAKAEISLTSEEITLGGKLGAEVNLVEGKVEGEICVTPRRVANPTIRAFNWTGIPQPPVKELGDNWDIGLCVNGELGGQVGVGASAEGELSAKPDRLHAGAKLKATPLLGVDVGAGASVIGLDKLLPETSDWRGAMGGLAPDSPQP